VSSAAAPLGTSVTPRQLQTPRADGNAAALAQRGARMDSPAARDLEDAAAVVTVLAALAGAHAGAPAGDRPPRSFWGDPGYRTAAPGTAGLRPGPHGWWASGLPR
jgi:hypothetical protein